MPVALPALAEIGGALLTLLAWGICLGLAYSWRHTIGRGLIWVADELDKAAVSVGPYTVHLFGPLTSALRWVSNSIATWLGEAALAAEHATIFLFNHFVSMLHELGHWFEEYSGAVLRFAEHTLTYVIPWWARWAFREARHWAKPLIHKAEALAGRIEHRVEGIALPRLREVEHELDALKAKVKSLTGSLSRDAIVALIGVTVWKELFGGKKCSEWDNLRKNRGCSAWSGIDDLLGLAFVTGLALDLPALIAEAQTVTPAIVKEFEQLAGLSG